MLVLCSFLAVLLVSACVTRSRAPVSASGSKVEIAVLSDRRDPKEMEARQWGWRNEVGQFMESDLVNQLNRAGYTARLIKSQNEFESADGRYLLKVEIKSYNPGSSAARVLVGFGAGAAGLDTHYELYGAATNPVLAWDDGVGTSQHWTKLPRKLNSNAVRKINEQLSAPK
jgi:hypothetical protein